MRNNRLTIITLTLIAALAAALPAQAQEERTLGSKNSTELGIVLTSGNSNTTSFNVRNLFAYDWEQADFDWEFGYLRATSQDDRYAVGNENNFEIVQPDSEPDNNRLWSNVRYLRNINESFFWYGRMHAEKDEPADIDYRFTPSVGAGNTWSKTEMLTFLTGYGISYTAESLALEGESSFAGYQLFYNLLWKIVPSTGIESDFVFDGSLDTGSNYRFDWYNGVSVAVNEHIALKSNVRFVYRNDPALEEIDLETRFGLEIGSVVVPKKKLDTAFTTSLVINF
ncbi:MAG: DUF481 domain-containing protein [Acidobacteriota bacterium]